MSCWSIIALSAIVLMVTSCGNSGPGRSLATADRCGPHRPLSESQYQTLDAGVAALADAPQAIRDRDALLSTLALAARESQLICRASFGDPAACAHLISILEKRAEYGEEGAAERLEYWRFRGCRRG